MLFSVDLPIQRLEAEIDGIERFTASDVRSPHLRLVETMPPLTPAAESIVRAMIRTYGMELFGRGSANAALRALIKAGPVKFGQTALLLGHDAPVPERTRPLVEEFNRVFERHPESGFAEARSILPAIGLPGCWEAFQQPRRLQNREWGFAIGPPKMSLSDVGLRMAKRVGDLESLVAYGNPGVTRPRRCAGARVLMNCDLKALPSASIVPPQNRVPSGGFEPVHVRRVDWRRQPWAFPMSRWL